MTNDNNMNVKAPWIKSLGGIPAHLDYYKGSMYDRVAEVSENFPDHIAYDFMGGKVKYKDFISKVDKCARALAAIGVKPGESVTIWYAQRSSVGHNVLCDKQDRRHSQHDTSAIQRKGNRVLP